MSQEKETGKSPPKDKRGLLIGVIVGLVILLVLAVVVLATPLKKTFLAKKSAPEISLELIGEQPEEEGKYRLEVEALVTGNPLPEVSFGRDDSAGEAGENRAWILLAPGEQYTLTAAAENSAGRASASLELEAPGEPEDSPHLPGTSAPAGPGASQKPETSQKPDPAEGEKTPESSPPEKNNPPVIEEINIDENIVFTGINYQITAVASDPDGDSLTYEWSGDGSIAGANANPITWTAPAKKGDYTIKVTVKDGRGGTATMSKVITVNNPISAPKLKKKTTLAPVKGGESGWIIENGSLTTTATYAGDNVYNQMVRGFVSFDIGELADREIILVKLRMTNPKVFGDPSAMGNLAMGTAHWGARKLVAADYNLSGTGFGWPETYDFTVTSKPDSEGVSSNLAKKLQGCIDDGLNRFQFRFQFSKNKTNDNNSPDGVQYEFDNISLYVEYY